MYTSLYSALIVISNVYYDKALPEVSTSVVSILGTALSFFLGFVTNSSYDRWWEARKKWGGIVNDSRTLNRLALSYAKKAPKAELIQFTMMQIDWCWSLARNLRRLDAKDGLQANYTGEYQPFINDSKNVPNSILGVMSALINKWHEAGIINDYQQTELERLMEKLTDHMGACERIKNTVFPTQYSFFIHILLIVFITFLPLGMVDNIGWYTVPVTTLIAGLFTFIEKVEVSMQDPFDLEPTDTPTYAISRTIEINLKQNIGIKELPQPVQDIDGALY